VKDNIPDFTGDLPFQSGRGGGRTQALRDRMGKRYPAAPGGGLASTSATGLVGDRSSRATSGAVKQAQRRMHLADRGVRARVQSSADRHVAKKDLQQEI
jgi:hypothetical protein